MKSFFKRYENILLVLALVVFASVLLANNARGDRDPNLAEKIALAISSPFQSLVTGTINKAVSIWDHYLYLVNTSHENDRLRKRLAERKMQNNLLMEELKKYRRVESLISYHPVATSRFQVADVIAWDSTNLARTFVINKGSSSQVKPNMVVLSHEGLIGRVVTATSRSARVLMLTDARSAVDAFVQNSRVRCIVVGQNKGMCLIKYLPVDSDVKPGDTLISSGLGGIFPKGVTLGTVAEVETDSDRLFYKAFLKPAVNLKKVEEVLVMTDFPYDSRAFNVPETGKPEGKSK